MIKGLPSDRIDGGAIRGSNLFQSFQEFNVREGRGAYFSNPTGIANIFSRVTGGNISQILGTLGVSGNANLYFLNPNGIVFGPNARLDVRGAFLATTADSFIFDNNYEFSASNPRACHQSAIPNSECSPRDKSLEVLTVKGFCFNMWNQRNALFSD